MVEPRDTIVAVSSPPGRAPRGLVRLAGPRSICVLGQLVSDPTDFPPRTLVRVSLRQPSIPALAALFPGPQSYTGDSMAELQMPGHPTILNLQLQRALSVGARLAQPGEFTLRAFLAGRMDLIQAEGISATIAAQSDAQLRAASLLREGGLGQLASRLAHDLTELLALVEAGIDFTDQDDVVPIGPEALYDGLQAIQAQLNHIMRQSVPWRVLEAIPWVVLTGRPSSGKSTLFNALLGRPRAVVSPAPGTTRDVLVELLQLSTGEGRRLEAMLVDIAGLEDASESSLDLDIQAAARSAIARADLVLAIDPVYPMPHVGKSTICVRSMNDLGLHSGPCDVAVSAHTGEGLDDLLRLIADGLSERTASLAGDMLALQPRHAAALTAAQNAIGSVLARLSPQRRERTLAHSEQIAAELREALEALWSLTGQGALTPDTILNHIFACFCIGK